MKAAWIDKPLQMKFVLGEIPLFAMTFPAMALEMHFTALTDNPSDLQLPLEHLASGYEVLVIRSHPMTAVLPRFTMLPQAIRYVPAQYKRSYIDLQGSFQQYLQKFSGKSRATLIRKVRKFAEFSGGEISWQEYRTPAEMRTFYALARDVSKKTYQERLLDAGLPDHEAFQSTMLGLAARDAVRSYLLFAGGEPIAYLYCPVQDNVLLYQYLGYNPGMKQWSPGTVLQYLALERLFAEGTFRMFDFTEGEGPHKAFFATGHIQCADMFYFHRTLRNQLLLRAHTGLASLSDTAVQLLDRAGLKDSIKKLLRARA